MLSTTGTPASLRARLVGAVAALFVLGSCTLSGVAHAQATGAQPEPVLYAQDGGPRAAAAGKVTLNVRVVHATNSGKVDPQLQDVMKQLKFTRYTGFKLLNTNRAQLAVGGETMFQIAGGRRLKVQLVDRTPEFARVRIRMLKGNERVLDTTVKIYPNRSFIIAGPSFQGGKLVLPVAVSY